MEGYLELITPVYENDELNQRIKTGEKVDSVWVEEISVTRSEFYNAGNSGHKAQLAFTTASANYSGQSECRFCKKAYSIYRTYKSDNETIELYLEEKVGIM